MTPELHALAREIAHKHTPRCTGGQPGGYYETSGRYHSKKCDALAADIAAALGADIQKAERS